MSSIHDLPDLGRLEILLDVAPEDLMSICTLNKDFYSFCSIPYFWKLRFEKDKLPLPFLEEGNDAREWLRIYNRSRRAMIDANDRFSSSFGPRFCCVHMWFVYPKVENLWIFDLPGIDYPLFVEEFKENPRIILIPEENEIEVGDLRFKLSDEYDFLKIFYVLAYLGIEVSD